MSLIVKEGIRLNRHPKFRSVFLAAVSLFLGTSLSAQTGDPGGDPGLGNPDGNVPDVNPGEGGIPTDLPIHLVFKGSNAGRYLLIFSNPTKAIGSFQESSDLIQWQEVAVDRSLQASVSIIVGPYTGDERRFYRWVPAD